MRFMAVILLSKFPISMLSVLAERALCPVCYGTTKWEEPMAITSRSVVTVSRTATVMEAVELMASAKVGSVLIVDNNHVEGIFSERDVMLRVVMEGRDPKRTNVEEVMTANVHWISPQAT